MALLYGLSLKTLWQDWHSYYRFQRMWCVLSAKNSITQCKLIVVFHATGKTLVCIWASSLLRKLSAKWGLLVGLAVYMSALMEPGTNCVAATTGGAGKFCDSASALPFWQPLRYLMTKSNSCMASAHRQSRPSIFCDDNH